MDPMVEVLTSAQKTTWRAEPCSMLPDYQNANSEAVFRLLMQVVRFDVGIKIGDSDQ